MSTQLLAIRTEPVAGPVDLLEFAGDEGLLFEREGEGLAGRGVAARIPLPHGVEDAPAAFAALAALGPDAVGITALAFDPGTAGELVVPQLVLRRASDGTATLTRIGDGRPPDAVRSAASAPDGFTLTSCRPHDEWQALVDDAVAEIRSGRMRKVVLAREVRVDANRPIVPSDVLGRLRALYPSCFVFSVEGFVGASPELLVARAGQGVRSHPMAGTLPRSGDPDVDSRTAAGLLASDKDRREHRAVVDVVADVLAPRCTAIDVPGEPAVVYLRNVLHLGTRVTGRLADPAPSALELAAALHPTPAVGGTPRHAALEWLRKAEGFDRGRYAGPVGWVDGRGDGAFAVGIRSAQLDGARARLMAGVGVVEGSDPAAELAETQLKLQALLAAVVRP